MIKEIIKTLISVQRLIDSNEHDLAKARISAVITALKEYRDEDT